jgi:hypothetical protein
LGTLFLSQHLFQEVPRGTCRDGESDEDTSWYSIILLAVLKDPENPAF